MLRFVFRSSVTFIDLEGSLKKRRRKKLMLGFKSFGFTDLVGFYIL